MAVPMAEPEGFCHRRNDIDRSWVVVLVGGHQPVLGTSLVQMSPNTTKGRVARHSSRPDQRSRRGLALRRRIVRPAADLRGSARWRVLSSRILLRPADLDRSRPFYRDVLGLAVYREFGPADDPAVVFFLGQGLLEVSRDAPGPPGASVMIWLQVRDVRAEHDRLAAAGVRLVRKPVREPWGLVEMWIEDPDGVPVVLVEVPLDHPLRREPR
jgi:catechol 2,3-dioxygenase-like lactoylglutathione lyase family enzyme